MNFSAAESGDRPRSPIRTLHQHTQSVGATGGVYKGQGRNQRRMDPNGRLRRPRRLSPSSITPFPKGSHLMQTTESSHGLSSRRGPTIS